MENSFHGGSSPLSPTRILLRQNENEDIPSVFSGIGGALKQKGINELDMGEDLEIIHNFEIEIHITQILYGN